MKKWNFIIALISTVLGAFVIYLSSAFPKVVSKAPGPGIWPSILGYILIGISILLVIVSLISKSDHINEKVNLMTPASKQVYKFMGLSVGFAIAMYILGLLLAVLLFIPAVMYMLEVRNLRYMGLTSILVTASIYIVFVLVLNSQLPDPIFMR